MKVTFYGQSYLAVEATGKSLVFDPFIRPDELARDADVPMVRADAIVVADAVELAGRAGAPVASDPAAGGVAHAFRP